jgi:hypothetical protein
MDLNHVHSKKVMKDLIEGRLEKYGKIPQQTQKESEP